MSTTRHVLIVLVGQDDSQHVLRTGRDESASMTKSSELEASQTPTLGGYSQPESSLKRKRSSPIPSMAPNAQLPPRNYSNFTQPTQSSPSGFTPSNIPSSSRLVGGQAPPQSNYTYQMEKPTSWQAAPSYQAQSSLEQERRVALSQPQNNHGG
ncbi:hypothetical protein G7Y89_g13814 [Cudoniella acicularis]|uniref:Uncharacterized protein n=1 Tax=Cudoniella acicularis TaxID=354080 RepID=A0A8H4VYB4_9HELO|nr:hypothetical protein G7Y89_g13814 [Cudoniella acicularis]